MVMAMAGPGCSSDLTTEWNKYCDAAQTCGANETDTASCKAAASTNLNNCNNASDIETCVDKCIAGGCKQLQSCINACPACKM